MNPTRHKNYKSTTEFSGFFFLGQTCILLFALLISDACLSLHVLSQINWRKNNLNIYNCVTTDLLSVCMFCDIHCQQQIHKSLVQKILTHSFLYFLSDFVPVYQMC